MSLANEFKLISCKWCFRIDQITDEEAKIWMDHLLQDGFNLDDSREIFTPFNGEESTFLNEDIGTDELRIRKWKWLDHELIDINAWPGDNESGVITIDGVPFLNNSDQNLGFIANDKTFDFSQRLEFFEAIRSLAPDDIDRYDESDNFKDIEEFYENSNGKEAVEMSQNGWDSYREQYDSITKEHAKLCDKYMHEFSFTKFIKEDLKTIAENLGCPFEIKSLKFVEWNYNGKIYTLVSVESLNYDLLTYLLDENGKLGPKVYDSNFIVKGDNNELVIALQPRIFSFIKVRNDVTRFTIGLY